MKPISLEHSVEAEISKADFHSPQEIAAHPQFEEAAALFTHGLAKLYSHDARLRTLIEFDHIVSFQLIICLASVHCDDDPDSWVTMPRLMNLLEQTGIAADRRMKDWVAALRDYGFVESRRSPTDARVRLLRPTAKMMELDREWLELLHSPLALLYPDEDFSGALSRDPHYQIAYRRASLQTVGVVGRIMGANPGASFFIRQSAGSRILMTLIGEARGTSDGTTRPGFMTRAAEASGVSRTHVRNVLRNAENMGLVRIGLAKNEGVTVNPRLRNDVANWVADSLAGTSITHRVALKIASNN